MQKMIITAALLLIVQIGLTVGFFTGSKDLAATPPDTLFLKFSPDSVQSISLTGEDGVKLELKKEENGWTMPEHFSAPADTSMVGTLLGKLANLKQGFIVATSDEAASRFKVAGEKYNQHLVIKDKDGSLADFYVGTSPALHQVHARRSDNKDIVIVNLESYELTNSPDKWLDKSMAKLHSDNLTALEFDGVKLKKEEKGWQIEGLKQGETPNQEEIDNLISQLGGLLVEDVVDPASVTKAFENPAFHFTAHTNDGKEVEYVFGATADTSSLLKTSDKDFYFKVASYTLENLKKQAVRDNLVKKETSKEAEAQATAVVPEQQNIQGNQTDLMKQTE